MDNADRVRTVVQQSKEHLRPLGRRKSVGETAEDKTSEAAETGKAGMAEHVSRALVSETEECRQRLDLDTRRVGNGKEMMSLTGTSDH